MTKHTESVNHLSNYMEYMKELGFEGLEIKENPFFTLQIGRAERERLKNPKTPFRTTEKPSPPPTQAISFNSTEILDLVKLRIDFVCYGIPQV